MNSLKISLYYDSDAPTTNERICKKNHPHGE